MNTPIAYEIRYNGKYSNLITSYFKLNFNSVNNANKNEYDTEAYCYLKKAEGNDLRLICELIYEGLFHLKKINEEIHLDNIHYKYNFIILPVDNKEIIYVNGFGTQVLFTYPKILNFTKEDNLDIKYVMSFPSNEYYIKLNYDSYNNLNCDILTNVLSCSVPVSHFEGKKDGYYDTYYSKSEHSYNITSIYYDASPFEVILPKDNF